MTKQEAYEAMLNGYRIRHYNYSPEEYAYIDKKKGQIVTEDGYPKGGKFDEFWAVYQEWEEDWEIVKSDGFNQFENEPFVLTNPYHIDEPTPKPLKKGHYVSVRTEPKIQRNESCPCGSGKKYKKCCNKSN